MGCGQSGTKQPQAKYKSGQQEVEKQEARRKNTEYISVLQALAKVPLLKRLPKDQHPILAASCVEQVFRPGDVVIEQGAVGTEFFVIRSGEASVFVAGEGGKKKVATVKEGDYFGENALLHDEPRNATIKADKELNCLKISREKFQELGLHMKLEFAKRQAVYGAGHQDPVTMSKSPPPPLKKKTPEERAFIITNLLKNQNLQTLGMDEKKVEPLADSAWLQEIEVDEKVIMQGDANAEFFYVVATGGFDVMISEVEEANHAEEEAERSGSVSRVSSLSLKRPKKVGSIDPGGSFGELALMYSVPRAATVQAREKSSVWVIDRTSFKRTLMKTSDEEIDAYEALLEGVEVFDPLLRAEKRAVAEALTELRFSEGDVVLEQGQQGDTFYILYEGEVVVIKDEEKVNTLTASKEKKVAHYFGERALINNEPRAATVKVTSSVAKALVLDKWCFDMLLGSVRELMKEDTRGRASAPKSRMSTMVADSNLKQEFKPVKLTMTENVILDDLELIGTLGVGAFGKVELREQKGTGKTYAVKMMSKGYIAKMKMQNNVINEKHILASVDSPFIIKLYNTSHNGQWIYFYMEPALGGELYVIYHRRCFHGILTHAQYYIASVILAFEHLHERHVIYRDLKPENLLLTSEGFLKVTDMGLAKFAIGKTYTTCGTPEYFAPEVIRSMGQTRAVDWWTLGILIFELMAGSAPFHADNDMAMYGKVLKGIDTIKFPPKCEGATETIVKEILRTDPSERLPMRHGGVQNLKSHKWFRGFDWEGLVTRRATPPYLPSVKSATDLRNFCHVKVHKANWIEFRDDGSNWDKDF
mmetsp:Transcript_62602/g.183071  ORF Transcript_62602/g.183071 Transcript_62602/m.183071 type:complete len:817 (-) Transcript_62602:89-2539(-)